MFDNIIIDVPFMLSVALNVLLLFVCGVLIWYSIGLLKKVYFVRDTIDAVNQTIAEFSEHLDIVNSMDTYYGDPTIVALLEHCKEVRAFVEDYKLQVLPDDYEEEENELEDEQEK